LVGYNNAGTINSCYSTTPDGDNVFGNYHIGGLVGQNYGSASIIKSYSTATVVGYVNYAGGLVGSNNNSTISNCYSRGSVSRSQDSNGDFGSFVGKNENTTEVTYCYSTGEVIYQNATNPTDKGFVGNYNATGYSYNFFDSETTKQSSGAGATAKDTDAMKGITPGNTLTDWGWSTDTWERIGANYPRLKDNPDPTLPIILSAFTAQLLENTPTIYWETQSEVDNMGWFVYRSDEYDFSTSKKISEFIEGHGTTTQQQTYLYEDRIQEPEVGDAYYYWLESIDYSGMINHYDRVAVLAIPDQSDPPQHITPPQVSELRAEPNPFIKSTRISFMLSETSIVDVSIYNIKGELVKSYPSQQVTAGNTAFLSWDGRGDNGKTLPVGIYLYKLQVNGTIQDTRRVILIR